MTENQAVIEIDLRRMAWKLLDRLWLIILVGVLCASMAFGYAYLFKTPQYSASAQLYVNNTYGESTPGFSSSQLSAAQGLVHTYMVILESRSVMEQVQEQTNLEYTYGQLRSMVSAAPVDDTEVFKVTVTCPNYKHAALIANAIADILPERIAQIVDGSSVRVVDYAVESSARVSPNYKKFALYGLALGVLLTVGLIVLMDLLDGAINSEEYLAHVYSDLPLLAVVSDGDEEKSAYYKKGYYASAQKSQPSKDKGGAKK